MIALTSLSLAWAGVAAAIPVPFLPLVAALALVGVLALARVHPPTDAVLDRLSLYAFGRYVARFRPEHPDRQAVLRAARVPETYREYGARTYLHATVFTLVGSVLGLYLAWGVLRVLAIDPAVLREALPAPLVFLANLGGVPALSIFELFVLLLVSSATVGIAAGLATYWLRWWYPGYVADARARRIDATLPATVALWYALARSGMEAPKIVRTVAESGDTYGAAAEEFQVAVRSVDTLGTDAVTALQTMGRRTASDTFREFSENLVSVLQSGQGLADFLERQYDDFQEEAESAQESMIDLLATLAEAYVTVLVAGPLFLITILVVIGFSIGETADPLRALIYLIVPFGNLAFVVYLSMVTDAISPSQAGPTAGRPDPTAEIHVPVDGSRRADGGIARPGPGGAPATDATSNAVSNRERIRLYRRLRTLRSWLGRPLRSLLDRPERLFVVTGPIALLALASQVPTARAEGLAAVDDAIVLTGFFLLATFAVAYEVHRRRIDAIEAAVPDFLDRLASVNDAGMPLIASFDRVRNSDLGRLDAELDRVWADLRWGADLETALWRFESRVRTPATSRLVTLLTRAMAASGRVAAILRIAARQAAADRRLRRERERAMLEYMVVVYVSYLVFLFIVVVLTAFLLPSLPAEGTDAANAATAGAFGGGDVDADTYEVLFYHATVIQGTLSGLIAGQLSTGDVRGGAKHAAAMVAVAFLLFAVVL